MQDTPAVKFTYDAKITVPNELKAKMSANDTGSEAVGEEKTMYSFKNDIKIPSYLIALAVGDLET